MPVKVFILGGQGSGKSKAKEQIQASASQRGLGIYVVAPFTIIHGAI